MEIVVIWIIRILAPLLGVGTLALTLPDLLGSPWSGLPQGYRLPGIALDLARDSRTVLKLFRAKKPDGTTPTTRAFRRDLKLDQYIVVPLYILLFVAVGLWLVGGTALYARWLGIAGMVCVALAGLFDTLENIRTFRVLDAVDDPPLADAVVDRMRQASVAKWAFIAGTLVFLSVPFLVNPRSIVVGVISLLTAVVFAVGLAGHRPLVEWGFGSMGLTLLAMFLATIVW
jgi:hypothetical protein